MCRDMAHQRVSPKYYTDDAIGGFLSNPISSYSANDLAAIELIPNKISGFSSELKIVSTEVVNLLTKHSKSDTPYDKFVPIGCPKGPRLKTVAMMIAPADMQTE